MKSFPRRFAVLAALATVALIASACDASPYAASVNSRTTKQTVLNSELRAWAASPTYVKAFDDSNSQSGGGSGVTVVGDAPGTYSAAWVANILTGVIDSAVVHQHLVATATLPSQSLQAVARSVSEFDHPGYWTELPAAFRQTLVSRLADEAAFGGWGAVPDQTLRQGYQQFQSYFFTQVCVVDVSAFSAAAAQAIRASGTVNGAKTCYAPADLEAQPATFRSTVMALAVGAISQPISTNFGFQVVQVVSRDTIADGPEVTKVLSAAVATTGHLPNTQLDQLVKQSHIQVNPAYGTWTSGQVAPPQLASS